MNGHQPKGDCVMFEKLKKLRKKNKKVMAILPLTDVISATSEGTLRKEGGSQEILDFLYDLLDRNERVDGLLLRMDTPGGAAGASEEIAELVARVKRERQIPVVVSIADICCSGGYMIACCADEIFANKGSMTGSIGCILQLPNYQRLAEKAGVTTVTVKAGKMKDIGNPMRPMTEEERVYLEAFAQETYEVFKAHVLEYRPQIKNQEEMFDGRPVGAVLAKENGLIDSFGGYYDAYDALLHKMGEQDDCNVEINELVSKPGLLRRLLKSELGLSPQNLLQQLLKPFLQRC